MSRKKTVHWKYHSEKGFISLLCRPEKLPDQEALITKTIEKCTCLTCLKLLAIVSENRMVLANGSLDAAMQN